MEARRAVTAGPDDPAFWEGRYASADTGWDLGAPSPPFVRLHQDGVIAPCRVAVPGCGSGWEVAWLARAGYRVTGIDFAPGAIAAAGRRLGADGVAAELLHADLFHLPARLDGAFDLVLEQTCFCAIAPARRADYVTAVGRLLRPGGRLVALFYACNGDDGPPFTTSPDEVRALFSGVFDITSLAVTPHSHARRLGQEWLGVLTRR